MATGAAGRRILAWGSPCTQTGRRGGAWAKPAFRGAARARGAGSGKGGQWFAIVAGLSYSRGSAAACRLHGFPTRPVIPMHIILRSLASLPLALLYVFAASLAFFIDDVLRWRREQIDRDLALAFPERTLTERRRIRHESYRRVADLFVEMIWGSRASADELRQRVVFDNPEVIERNAAAGHSCVLLAPHFCNWEWLLMSGGITFGFPIDAVYKPQRLSGLDRFLRETRSRFGGKPIPQGEFVFEIMNRAGQLRGYALIADQTPRPDDRKYWTRFLNRDTAFFVGAEKVARFLDAPIFYVGMRRLARGHYVVHFTPLAQPPYDGIDGTPVMEGFARCLEAAIATSPADWLWLQKRWKYPRPPAQ
jgi:KDO2-lipid IV(A) lauroyltransferase